MTSQEYKAKLKQQNAVDKRLVLSIMHEKSETSFNELFKIHYNWVFAKSLHIIKDYHDAEDVTSIIFAKLWKKLILLKFDCDKGTFRAWLNILSKNTIIDFVRSDKKKKEESVDFNCIQSQSDRFYCHDSDRLIISMDIADDKAGPIEYLIENECIEVIESALEKVRKPEHRIAYILRHLENYSVKEITRILNQKDGTIKIWIFRCKEELREILPKYLHIN